jgi:hypothetical protein
LTPVFSPTDWASAGAASRTSATAEARYFMGGIPFRFGEALFGEAVFGEALQINWQGSVSFPWRRGFLFPGEDHGCCGDGSPWTQCPRPDRRSVDRSTPQRRNVHGVAAICAEQISVSIRAR